MNSLDYVFSGNARKEILDLLNLQGIESNIRLIKDFDVPTKLYRYTTVSKYMLSNLKTNSLTATTPTEFNDIYDSSMHLDHVNQYRESFKKLNEGSRLLGYKDVITPEMEIPLIKQAKELDEFSLTYLAKDFSIVCLSSNPRDIKMWGQYSNNNKGICIAYNFDQGKYDHKKFIYPVIYIDSPIAVSKLMKDDNKIMLATLTSVIAKFRDWEYEKEWRMVLHFVNNEELRINIYNIPNPEFIILGSKFIENIKKSRMNNREEYNLLKEFINYVEETKVKLKIVKPQIRSFNLEFEDIQVEDILNEF